MNRSTSRSICLTGLVGLLAIGCLFACTQKTETTTTTTPIDTTVVDDDTLEVNDTVRSKQTEYAR